MSARKQYAAPDVYEAKLEKVMARFGVEEYDYDWSRRECYVAFRYKGGYYRFEHTLEKARAHGVNIDYGSDLFAQVVLALEDLARMVGRGIYDLSTWVEGMKMLPEGATLEPCFAALGFSQRPATEDEVKKAYRRMSKVMHPDAGGDAVAFQNLTDSYKQCLELMSGEART